MKGFYVALALAAGLTVPVQAGINNLLRRYWAGDASLAALISFVVGTLALVVWFFAARIPWPQTPVAEVPWWAWSGGVIGAFFVTATVFLAPRLGAGSMVALVVAGQMLASLVLDHYGLVGFEVRTATTARLAGAALLVVGAALMQKG